MGGFIVSRVPVVILSPFHYTPAQLRKSYALLANIIGAVVSAFASTAGTLGATLPILLPPLQEAGFGNISGVLAAFAIAASIVDVSPTSPGGALLLANVQNRDRSVFFRQLLYWAVAMVFVGSILPWMLLVVVGLG